MKQWEAVFFDFDGVVLDSVGVKTQAFATMFSKYGPTIEKAVVDYHLANGGVSRFKKFEYYYKHLINKPIDQETLTKLGQEFNEIALRGVLEASFMPGVVDTLNEVVAKKIPAFVASGTPDEEMKLIVERRELSRYFLEVHGSPTTKDAIVRDVAGRHGLRLSHCLFLGDATTDYQAAKACGVTFLGIVKEGEASPFPEGTLVSSKVFLPPAP